MRILQVAPRFSLEHGGGGVVIISSLVKELAKREHDVLVYASDFGYWHKPDFWVEWINDFRLCLFRCSVNIATLHITPNLCKVAHDDLRYGNYDVIHMQGCRTFQNIVVRHYAKKYGIPYIVDAHGFPVEGTFWRKLFIRLFDALFANRIVRDAAFCIAETQIGVEEYKRAGVDESKIVVIPCPYDLSIFDSLPRRGQFKRKNRLGRRRIVLYLGGLEYIKGLDFLVKSFAKLNRDDTVLVLVGSDGGYEKTLRTMVKDLGIEDRVLFTGYLGGTDKLEALVDADVAVFPSRAEQGLPFAALEAIMCDTPVIVADGTGAAEDIKRMGCMGVAEFRGEVPLAFCMSLYLETTPTQACVKQAQAYIKKNLSMAERVKDYEKLYERCVK